MIDIKVLRLDPDRLRASQRARGESESLVDDLVTADEARRNAIAQYEELRAEQKALGKRVAQANGEERAVLLSRTKELADMVKKAEAAQNEISIAFDQMLRQVGNVVFDDVPPGGEDDYRPVGDRGYAARLRGRGLPTQRSLGTRPVACSDRR